MVLASSPALTAAKSIIPVLRRYPKEEPDHGHDQGHEVHPVDTDENTPLLASGELTEVTSGLSGCRKRRKKLLVSSIVIFLLTFGIVALFYYILYWSHAARLKVYSMNVWGMPGGMGGCKFKGARIKAISELISKTDFDLFLMQELWMQADHELIAANLPEGFHMTGFRQLASASCDGRVLPTTCSGLAIISRFPFKELEFNRYTEKGSIWDGEFFSGKGVGRARIELFDGRIPVDVFTTHTIADSGTTMSNNTATRILQVRELMNTYIGQSNASVIILGGDFNTEPKSESPEEPYEIMKRIMVNSAEELFAKLARWLDPDFATYANKKNTFSGGEYKPQTIDYLFHKTKEEVDVIAWSHWFEVNLFKAWIPGVELAKESLNGTAPKLEAKILQAKLAEQSLHVSLSDHEAITSIMYVRNPERSWPF